jgi:hypothetical protein
LKAAVCDEGHFIYLQHACTGMSRTGNFHDHIPPTFQHHNPLPRKVHIVIYKIILFCDLKRVRARVEACHLITYNCLLP